MAYNEHTGSPDGNDDQRAALRIILDRWPLPLTVDVNPMLEQAVARHRSWLVQHGLADSTDPTDPLTTLGADQVAAYAYPRADLPTLVPATDWTAWFFHFDDYLTKDCWAPVPTSLARQLTSSAPYSAISMLRPQCQTRSR